MLSISYRISLSIMKKKNSKNDTSFYYLNVIKNDNETTKYQENQLKHIKYLNSHKIKAAANLQLAFYFMEYNNLVITVQIWKELLSIFKILMLREHLHVLSWKIA